VLKSFAYFCSRVKLLGSWLYVPAVYGLEEIAWCLHRLASKHVSTLWLGNKFVPLTRIPTAVIVICLGPEHQSGSSTYRL